MAGAPDFGIFQFGKTAPCRFRIKDTGLIRIEPEHRLRKHIIFIDGGIYDCFHGTRGRFARCPGLRLRLLATDADEHLLERARQGRYPASSLKDAPSEWLAGPLVRSGAEYEVRAELRERVEFQKQDIRHQWPRGPFDLVQLCRDTQASIGVDRAHVRYELFTTPDGEPRRTGAGSGASVARADDRVVTIDLTLDGTSATVESPASAHESILTAALRVRPDAPFACAGGVCGTCRARLVEGAVTMTENYALEPDELEAGYVLTCQSHPTTDRVVVDYDG